MKKNLVVICVLLYAVAVSLGWVWDRRRTKPVYVDVPGIGERGEPNWAVASALAAVKQQKLLRGDVYKLVAVRDKKDKGTWGVTFLFEDPPIIGGDVITTVHADGKVTVMPGF